MPFDILPQTLLTGAGFTKNFGGFLGPHMWSVVFNSPKIQQSSTLASLMRKELDFESVYSKVIYGKKRAEDKKAFMEAMENSYEKLDSVLRQFMEGTPSLPSTYNLRDLLEWFSGEEGGKDRGYIFTLNQDLFVERWYIGDKLLRFPGMDRQMKWLKSQTLSTEHIITVPTSENMRAIEQEDAKNISSSGRFHYVKLHGSQNWRTSDGRNAMVIGWRKDEIISREPLLNWYAQIFRRVLLQGDVRLLVIGYSFRDHHINEIISKSIRDSRLKMYVLSPSDPLDFKNELLTRPQGRTLWKGLAGYFPYLLRDVCPGGTPSIPSLEIKAALKG